MTSKAQKQARRQGWIENTQLFQRIAGVAETPAEQLGLIYDKEQAESATRRARQGRKNEPV